jgi:predicted dehydrogenase
VSRMLKGKDKLRFVIVGAGHMGLKHLQKIIQVGERIGACVSVVVEPDEKRTKQLVQDYGSHGIKFVTNLGAISSLGAEYYPEAAIVAVPASIHVETAKACLDNKWHTLIEKPLGFSALDCKEIEDASVKSHRIVQVGLLERWALSHLWDDWQPKWGPLTIQAVRSGPFVPRAADTDVIHDLMIHDIDLFVLLDDVFGLSSIKNVRAWGRKLRSDHIDYAKVALDLENGGTAHFFASRLAADSSRRWELTGPSWHASIDLMRRQFKSFEKMTKNGKTWFEPNDQNWEEGDPLGLEIEAFVQRVRGTFDSISGISAKDPIFSFWDPKKIIPTPQSVLKTHEIIDEILSNIRVLES